MVTVYVEALKIIAIVSLVIAIALVLIALPKILQYLRYKPVEVATVTPITNGGTINETIVLLPYPKLKGNVSVEEALLMRRSIREYLPKPLTLQQLAQILWAAQGITELNYKFRTAPSAGATYPLELYVVVKTGGVEGLRAGIYKYDVETHTLMLIKEGDFSDELARAALDQDWVRNAPVNIVIVAEYERTTRYYGSRGYQYVHMEVGHVGENIYLQAVALNLGTVAVGAFYDDQVAEILDLPSNYRPLYIMPVGAIAGYEKLSLEELVSFYEKNREAKGFKKTP